MSKRVILSGFEQSLLERRSDVLLFGAAEIFLEAVVEGQTDVSPSATAAKLIADFAQVYAALAEHCGAPPAYEKIDVTGPMGKLFEPLISGGPAYLENAADPAQIFEGMLDWLGADRWHDGIGEAGENRFVVDAADGRVRLDGDAVAAYLTLGVLLDSADVQVAVDQDLRLDLVHTFRCFSHLFGQTDRLIAAAAGKAATPDEAMRAIFVAGLKCLTEDDIRRDEEPQGGGVVH